LHLWCKALLFNWKIIAPSSHYLNLLKISQFWLKSAFGALFCGEPALKVSPGSQREGLISAIGALS
jgi:hypothetical protein